MLQRKIHSTSYWSCISLICFNDRKMSRNRFAIEAKDVKTFFFSYRSHEVVEMSLVVAWRRPKASSRENAYFQQETIGKAYWNKVFLFLPHLVFSSPIDCLEIDSPCCCTFSKLFCFGLREKQFVSKPRLQKQRGVIQDFYHTETLHHIICRSVELLNAASWISI